MIVNIPVILLYNLLFSSDGTSELMYGFELSQVTRRLELPNHKTEKGILHVRIKLTDIFGFANQNKVTHGLGYSLTLKRNNIILFLLEM